MTAAGVADSVVPVTYMNSSADIKAFCGRNGGVVCTSSNAEVALEWAYAQKPDAPDGAKVLFLPDQHLGRNTAVLKMGLTLDDCVVWDPHRPNGGLTAEQLRDAKMILWKGHCSVHGRFAPEVVDSLRAEIPGINILVHPECRHEVVLKADLVCSTEFIVYKAKERMLTDFLYSLIDSVPFSDFMCSHVTGSTGSRQRTIPSDTLQYQFHLPTAGEIAAFSAMVAPMYAQIRINAMENARLKALRDSLLPRLMSGEIEVSDIEI
jgi:hypothetical protein